MDCDYFDKHAPIDISYRKLPHWNQDGKIYFVTFRLHDSLPKTKLDQLRSIKDKWLNEHPAPLTIEQKLEYHRLFDQKIDKWLDAGYGACVLKDDACGRIVENAIWHYDGIRYIVHGYVVMSNHVHLMLQPSDNYKLEKILHSIKSFSANAINKQVGRCGKLWGAESYDRIIRDSCHYHNVKNYLFKNVSMGGIRWHL